MTDIRVEQHGEIGVATAPSVGPMPFYGWAKRGAIETRSPIAEPGDVWFTYGRSRDEVVAALLREMGSLS